MRLRITTLSENTANMGDFLAEWGLSFLVETEKETILFDTGKSITTSHNARALGIDLSRVDKIVLSHGHSDHSGGLRQVLRVMRKKVEVIAHPDVWANKYSRRQGKRDRFSGIPFQWHTPTYGRISTVVARVKGIDLAAYHSSGRSWKASGQVSP